MQIWPAQRKAARAARVASDGSTTTEGRALKFQRRLENSTRDKARSGMDSKARQVSMRTPETPIPETMDVQVPLRSATGASAPPDELGTCSVDQLCPCAVSACWGSRRLTHAAENSALKTKAEKAHPEEYRRSSKKYAYDEY